MDRFLLTFNLASYGAAKLNLGAVSTVSTRVATILQFLTIRMEW